MSHDPTPKLPETADALRQRIDSGDASDKVDFPDPAASPLGTDDEAAGTPPSARQVRAAARAELRPASHHPARQRSIEGFPWPYLAIVIPLMAAIMTVIWFALQSR